MYIGLESYGVYAVTVYAQWLCMYTRLELYGVYAVTVYVQWLSMRSDCVCMHD